MSNLKEQDYTFAKRIADQTLKLDDKMIGQHIIGSIKSFISDKDLSSLEERNTVYLFLQHVSTLFLNYDINSHLYLLTHQEVVKAETGRLIIAKIISSFRRSGDFDWNCISSDVKNDVKNDLGFTKVEKKWWQFWK